jgi:hypothetical protein
MEGGEKEKEKEKIKERTTQKRRRIEEGSAEKSRKGGRFSEFLVGDNLIAHLARIDGDGSWFNKMRDEECREGDTYVRRNGEKDGAYVNKNEDINDDEDIFDEKNDEESSEGGRKGKEDKEEEDDVFGDGDND